MFKGINKSLFLVVLTAIIAVIAIVATSTMISNFRKNTEKVTVNIDRATVVQKVQSMSKLQTVSEVLQRKNLEITLDLGDFSILGKTILENKRTVKISVYGTVTAGIDLSKIKDEDIIISADKKNLTLKLPQPEILAVSILEDQTDLLSDDYTLLFALNNLTSEQRRQTNEFLLQQIIKQGKTALIEASCEDNILQKANENAKKAIFSGPFDNLLFESINVETQQPSDCNFDELASLAELNK